MNDTGVSAWHFARLALQQLGFSPEARCTLVNISENATFRIDESSGQSFALRIHRDGYHSDEEIDAELSWMTALRHSGAAVVPVPVIRNGTMPLFHIHDDEWGHFRRAVLFEWESGAEPVLDSDLLATAARIGNVAAALHHHARRWKCPAEFRRKAWTMETALTGANPHWGRWQEAMGMTPQMLYPIGRAVLKIGDQLARYGSSPEQFGLAHCDLRLANLLVAGDTIKVLDFDDCGFSWFMYDAATLVSFHEDDGRVPALMAAWCEGYRQFAPLSTAAEKIIGSLIMFRRILLMAWLASHASTELAQSLGVNYTLATASLAEAFLTRTE